MDDVRREALVEQVLHDHAVAVAAQGASDSGGRNGTGKGVDVDADERMEREFRAQFLERQGGGVVGGGGGGSKKDAGGEKKEGVTSGSGGPRLGGSRSARARYADAMEKEREKGKEGK